MDILIAQAVSKVKKALGKLVNLQTEDKSSAVAAINEVAGKIRAGRAPTRYEMDVESVQDETRRFYFQIGRSGFIKGIKLTDNEFTQDVRLKILTKPLAEGGEYVYDSGVCTNVIWDIMEIPFVSEDGRVWCELTNSSILTTFNLEIYMLKGM